MKIDLIRDDKTFRLLSVQFLLPEMGKIDGWNEFCDYSYKGYQMKFPTELSFSYTNTRDSSFCVSILGFGIRINNSKPWKRINEHGKI